MTTTMQKNTITLPAFKFHQDGHNLFLTLMEADDLDRFTKIDHYNPDLASDDQRQGYQRREEAPRVKRLGNWLKNKVDAEESILLPTALLASTRNADVVFDSKASTITLSTKNQLHIVDGQHRRAGLLYAIREKKREALKTFPVPLVVIENLSKQEEMEQFALVNGTQKGVRTDLVNMILTQLAAAKGDDAIQEKDQWKVVVSRVIEALNASQDGPWHNMIVMPNETAPTKKEVEANSDLANERLVRATSFMTSLKPIYDYFDNTLFDVQGLTTEQRASKLAEVVGQFWIALRDLNPEVFSNPGAYVIQKTPGIFALHRVCKRLLPVMHMARRNWDAENFKIMLSPCEEFENSEYWDAKNGDASKYGSMKGFAELADLLWANLRAE